MTSEAERRAYPRASLEIEAWVATDGARLHATTKDLSIGGVGLTARAAWTRGDEVELVLDLPGLESPLALAADVAWRREEWVGVRFKGITPEQEAIIQQTVNAALGIGEAAEAPGFDDDATGEITLDFD